MFGTTARLCNLLVLIIANTVLASGLDRRNLDGHGVNQSRKRNDCLSMYKEELLADVTTSVMLSVVPATVLVLVAPCFLRRY